MQLNTTRLLAFSFRPHQSSVLEDKKVSFSSYFSFLVITKAEEIGFPFESRALVSVLITAFWKT